MTHSSATEAASTSSMSASTSFMPSATQRSAAALRCVALGMKLVLADIDEVDAASVAEECVKAGASKDDVVVQKCDCRQENDVRAVQRA